MELDGVQLYAWAFSAFLLASLVGAAAAGDVADRRALAAMAWFLPRSQVACWRPARRCCQPRVTVDLTRLSGAGARVLSRTDQHGQAVNVSCTN